MQRGARLIAVRASPQVSSETGPWGAVRCGENGGAGAGENGRAGGGTLLGFPCADVERCKAEAVGTAFGAFATCVTLVT